MASMRSSFTCLLGAVCLFVTGQEVSAEALSPERARQVTEFYYAALDKQGFAGAVGFLHPGEIERFRAMVMPGFERERAVGRRTLINATFGRDADLIDVQTADSADFLRRFARLAATRNRELPVGYDEVTVLGSVEEGDNLHILSRIRSDRGAHPALRLEVLSLRPYDGEWRVLLDDRLAEMARSLGGQRRESRFVPRIEPMPEPAPRQAAETPNAAEQ